MWLHCYVWPSCTGIETVLCDLLPKISEILFSGILQVDQRFSLIPRTFHEPWLAVVGEVLWRKCSCCGNPSAMYQLNCFIWHTITTALCSKCVCWYLQQVRWTGLQMTTVTCMMHSLHLCDCWCICSSHPSVNHLFELITIIIKLVALGLTKTIAIYICNHIASLLLV